MRNAECGQTTPPETVRCADRPNAADLARVDHDSSFEDWQKRAPRELRADPIWRVTAYRLALYAVETGWNDARILDCRQITRPIGSQLYRALGSIPANIAEGYSRSSGPDRARLFEYGLGSVRESTCWYFAARPVLGQDVLEKRDPTLSQIRRLLLASIPIERQRPRLRST
jgi:four helix bundle protein